MSTSNILQLGLCLAALFIAVYPTNSTFEISGIDRTTCFYVKGSLIQPVSEHRKRLHLLREQMLIRASLKGPEIDAYILPSYDEHLNEVVATHDRRLQYLTGFTGPIGLVAITLQNAAFWTEERYLEQANGELDCDWEIFRLDDQISITKWLMSNLVMETRVGIDPHIIPHHIWKKWETELYDKFIRLVNVNNNLVDFIWRNDRPPPPQMTIKVQEVRFAGERWQSKIVTLRQTLSELQCDAMIVTSLTEIAYMLNIRSRDIPYIPVVKGYLLVTQFEIMFYTDRTKVPLGVFLHLKGDLCHNDMCVKIKDYNDIWRDLRTYQQIWKRIMLPAPCVFDKGVSEAIFSAIHPSLVFEKISPIIYMRAQKNDVEQAGMKMAHIRDGAAMCEAMFNLEDKFFLEKWTELKVKYEVERSRLSQPHSKGLSLETVVAFGKHSSLPYYTPSNITDIEVTDRSTLVIESGGQYLEGTTDVSRTFHFGEPTDEQKRAYTTVLAGIITLSKLKFPANLHPSEIDALSRSPVWDSMSDYPHGTGHGIGSYLSVQESPIDVSYTNEQKYTFQEGYFLSNGLAMKSLTSSRRVIEILNKFSNCVNYHYVEKLETELAFSSDNLQSYLLPQGMMTSEKVCTGVAFDNYDRFVETSTGKNTLHDTVGIAYQILDPSLSIVSAEKIFSAMRGRKRRAYVPAHFEIEPYYKRPKMCATFADCVTTDIDLFKPSLERAGKLDYIWLISLICGWEYTPMWTGWNAVHVEENLPQQQVFYLPPINESPTIHSVVLETLKRSIEIANQCNQKYIFVTYDLAIAKIALQIQHMESPRFDRAFILLGNFHIEMAFYKTIGNFFDGSGAEIIIVESGLLAQGSLNAFISEPGYYKLGSFGIRLGNVLQVVDTGYQHPSGEKFLAFEGVTLVPYEPKLIDRTLLSAQEKRWLNEYNAKIRQLVGEELKKQGNMQAFYWMMNKTMHVREYLPEYEYRKRNKCSQISLSIMNILLILCYNLL